VIPTRLLAALLLGALGCASASTVPPDFALAGGRDSVVFGRLVLELGRPIGFFDRLDRSVLVVEHKASHKEYRIGCDQKGSDAAFYAVLPPGSYWLVKVVKGNKEGMAEGRFSVPPGRIVYVGALRFVEEGLAASLALSVATGTSLFLGRWKVEDRYDEAVRDLRSRYPVLRQDVVRASIEVGDPAELQQEDEESAPD
jgi:hypothetical protein